MIVNSQIIIDTNNGTTRSITERHTHDDGSEQLHSYITDMSMDVELAMQLRAQNINAAIKSQAAAAAEAQNFSLPLSKREFRDLFTQQEQEDISEFNATFENNPALSTELKKSIRAGLQYYNDGNTVNLNHEKTVSMVNLYEMLGLISAGRAEAILNG